MGHICDDQASATVTTNPSVSYHVPTDLSPLVGHGGPIDTPAVVIVAAEATKETIMISTNTTSIKEGVKEKEVAEKEEEKGRGVSDG